MLSILDRMYLWGYFRSYMIVLISLLSLYIVVDLFTNLDDFSGRGFVPMLVHIGKYYSVRISEIFDRLSEAISLLGAMFTVAWMQRNNELLPQLSAGISTRRVIRPILLGSVFTLALGPLNQEFVIPRIAEELTIPRDDPELDKPTIVHGVYDQAGMHVEGIAGYRKDQKVQWFFITFPETGPGGMIHLTAREAQYIPPGAGPQSGGWMLFNTEPGVIEGPLPNRLVRVSPGQFFLTAPDIDFDAVTRGARWYLFASTPRLRELLAKPDARRQSAVAVVFHMRITRPIIGGLLVVLGLAVILRDQNRNVFISAGLCLVMCACFYAAVYGFKFMGENDILSPAMAAWMPVLIFGPLAVTLFDAIHT
jgi:lipopolysaccharide export system permease protein